MKKIIEKLASVVICIAVIFTVIFWVWYLYPYNPLVIKEPLEVLNEDKTVKAGEILFYRSEFIKNTDVIPVITRTLVDGIVYTLPTARPINLKGKHSQVVASLVIPQGLPEGIYHFNSVACYQMNPIREVCVSYGSEEFKVIK